MKNSNGEFIGVSLKLASEFEDGEIADSIPMVFDSWEERDQQIDFAVDLLGGSEADKETLRDELIQPGDFKSDCLPTMKGWRHG